MRDILELPTTDIRPHDRFEVYRSTRTGFYLLYQYRRHAGAAYEDEARLAIYSTQRAAVSVRNRLRKAEEQARAQWEWDERERVMGDLVVQWVAGAS